MTGTTLDNLNPVTQTKSTISPAKTPIDFPKLNLFQPDIIDAETLMRYHLSIGKHDGQNEQ